MIASSMKLNEESTMQYVINKDGTVKQIQNSNSKHKDLNDLIRENEKFKRKALEKKALSKSIS